MSERYPRIRKYFQDGRLGFREGLILCFFMKRSHGEVVTSIRKTLEIYLDKVGREKLGWHYDMEGELQPLDAEGWKHVHHRLLGNPQARACSLQLEEFAGQVSGFHFQYAGKRLDPAAVAHRPGLVSSVSFWLPTEYLEEHGPEQVKHLAVALASELPLNSGYVSLSFNHMETPLSLQLVRELCFQYRGMDVHDLTSSTLSVGTRVRSAYWLNFFGQPLVGQLGGAQQLRARLPFPEVTVQELEGEKVLVSLGEWPMAGEAGSEELRLYRALSQVLEPYLYEEVIRWSNFSPENLRRWQRRFLE